MNILFNFSFLKSGGGNNVGLNFLSSLKKSEKYFFIVIENSPVHSYLIKNNFTNISLISGNVLLRTLMDMTKVTKIMKDNKIDILYTYFGFSLNFSKVPQVIGSADSNLYYPEINFWSDFKGFSLFKRKLIDLFRIYSLKKSDGIIFENPLLEKKCHQIYKVKALTTCILPSINLSFENENYNLVVKNKKSKTGLFLCGWQKHKGILKIPQIAHKLKQNNIKFNFIITAPINYCKTHREFNSLVEKYNVAEYISIIGNVSKKHIKSIYEQIDLVFLISKLESFSNNVIEAWAYKKVLIISDKEWAHATCGDAAVYVNRNNINDIFNKINNIINNTKLYSLVVNNGIKQLSKLNSIEEKTSKEINFLNLVNKK